jgi:DNA-binding protein YbaB
MLGQLLGINAKDIAQMMQQAQGLDARIVRIEAALARIEAAIYAANNIRRERGSRR